MNAQQYITLLPALRVTELRALARLIQAPRGKRVKRGRYVRLNKDELLRAIRREIGRNGGSLSMPFRMGDVLLPSRLERFGETVQGYLDRRPT